MFQSKIIKKKEYEFPGEFDVRSAGNSRKSSSSEEIYLFIFFFYYFSNNLLGIYLKLFKDRSGKNFARLSLESQS